MGFSIERHSEVTNITTYQDSALGIMRWGRKNSFPKTLENLVKQSPNAYPAVKRTALFYKGGGFEGDDEIINSNGLTLKDLVSVCSDDQSLFGAFAIHCNYNLKGEVSGITPMRISDLRLSEFDELNYAHKVGYHYNFGHNSEIKKNVSETPNRGNIKWFNKFNPDYVIPQIEEAGGLPNYLGQILYFSSEGASSYPIPPLQAPINYVLSDIENSILVRKETSTGFINSYILKTSLNSEDNILRGIEQSIEEAQGARGTGKVITISGMSPEDLKSTLLEEIGSGRDNAISSAKMAYELDKEVIINAYLIPPALAGIDGKSGFSGNDLEEAYKIFNAITKGGRNTIEAEINKILDRSVFKARNIKIKELSLIDDVVEDEDETFVSKE